jgi:Domain of unknown function (DUF4381)
MNPQSNPALSKLHDYYQPAPPRWVPQTIGWYVLFTIIALLLLWLLFHAVRQWFANRYRRDALRELATATPDQFSVLLKRTALAAWPREKVASLSGDDWLSFLNAAMKTDAFITTPGNRIEQLALRQDSMSTDDEHALRAITAQWIRRHHVQD